MCLLFCVNRAEEQIKLFVSYGWTHAWITAGVGRKETQVRVNVLYIHKFSYWY